MTGYLRKRVLLAVPTLLGVTVVIFAAVRFLPGSTVDQVLATYGTHDPELRRQIEEHYALSSSLPKQYGAWLWDLLRGDFGTSYVSGRPVIDDLKERLPVTLELGLIGMAVSVTLAVPIGTLSAIRQDSIVDYVARSIGIILLSVPNFWVALLVVTYGFLWFGWTPPVQYRDLWEDPASNLAQLWLPGCILGALLAGSVMRLTRSTMLEVLRQDYIRTAWGKGLSERAVVLRHALRNALIPVMTTVGLQVPVVMGGTVILERIFSVPGMGSHFVSAVNQRDYPMVQAVVLIMAVVVILTNIIVDLGYLIVDPRIRLR